MQDTVLYNKYRPTSFSEVVGQDHVTKVLEAHLQRGSLPHSLILYGPPGTGKTTVGRIVAKTLNPHDSGLIEKDSGIEATKDAIRTLKVEVEHIPYEGDYKTYLFDEAHRVTRDAFDGLLKTIEEPPPHVKFIFVTSQFTKIPPSIRSRCECHGFRLMTSDIIESRLSQVLQQENVNVSRELLNLVIEYSGGSLRDALVSLETVISQITSGADEASIIRSLGVISSSQFASLVTNYLQDNYKELDSSSSIFLEPHIDLDAALADFQQFLMDLSRAIIYSRAYPDVSLTANDEVQKIVSTITHAPNALASIHKMFKKSVTLCRDVKYVNNKKALIQNFVNELYLP